MAMAHGYAKAAGKPMLVCVHGTVGLLHSSMALFQAWADRVPVFVIVGHHRNPAGRHQPPAQRAGHGRDRPRLREVRRRGDDARAVRGVGDARVPHRDDAADGAGGARRSTRSCRKSIARTSAPRIPELSMPSPPQGDASAVREAARLLVNAETPLIQIAKLGRTPKALGPADRAGRTAAGAGRRAGLLRRGRSFRRGIRCTAPAARGYTPDVTLGLEVIDMSAQARAARASGRKTISISSEHLFQHSNIHDFGRYADVDLAIAADAEATLPSLIEEVQRLDDAGAQERDRRRAARASRRRTRTAQLEGDRGRAGTAGTPARSACRGMIAELGDQIKNDDWAIVSGHQFTGDWQRRLLNYDKPYRYNGDSGGFGIGYDSPASVGGALAHKKAGPSVDRHRRRRRPELQPGRAVDGRAPQDPAAARRPQQPRVPRGSDDRAADVRRAAAAGSSNAHIGNVDHRSQHQLRADGEGVRDVQRGADRQPERSGGARISARWRRCGPASRR